MFELGVFLIGIGLGCNWFGGGTSLNLSMSMMSKKCASVEWEYDAKQNLTCKVKNKQIIDS